MYKKYKFTISRNRAVRSKSILGGGDSKFLKLYSNATPPGKFGKKGVNSISNGSKHVSKHVFVICCPAGLEHTIYKYFTNMIKLPSLEVQYVRCRDSQGRSKLDNWREGGALFIYSCSLQVISFESIVFMLLFGL